MAARRAKCAAAGGQMHTPEQLLTTIFFFKSWREQGCRGVRSAVAGLAVSARAAVAARQPSRKAILTGLVGRYGGATRRQRGNRGAILSENSFWGVKNGLKIVP